MILVPAAAAKSTKNAAVVSGKMVSYRLCSYLQGLIALDRRQMSGGVNVKMRGEDIKMLLYDDLCRQVAELGEQIKEMGTSL
jgi:hypothetical protein